MTSSIAAKINTCINRLCLPTAIKRAYSLDTSSSESIHFFASLTPVLSEVFTPTEEDKLVVLSTAVYLGARAVYTIDPVMDLQVQGAKIMQPLINSHFLFQESQRLLTQLFPFEDPFWQMYYKRKEAHFQELTMSKQVDVVLNLERYKELLLKKYALIFVPVDALYCLNQQQDKETYDLLIHFLSAFIIGYNIPNEVRGLREDRLLSINNYAYWRLKEAMASWDMNADEYGHEDLHKFLYASGLAEILYQEAINYLGTATSLITHLNLPLLNLLVQQRTQETMREMNEVTTYMNTLKDES